MGNRIKRTSMWLAFVLGETEQTLERGGTDANACLTLYVERQEFTIRWYVQIVFRLALQLFYDM